MKEEPAFKAPQGNPAIFRVISSRGPFLLRQKMQGASHITISEGILFLMCLWKVSLPLQLKTGNQFSSREDFWCMELSLSCCTQNDVPLDLRRLFQGISAVY